MTTPLQRASDQANSVLSKESAVNSSVNSGADHYAEELLSKYYDGVIGLNKNGTITFVNKTACKILGCTQEEIKYKPLEKIFQFYNEVIEHPYIKIINNIIESGNVFGPITHHRISTKKNNDVLVDFSISPLDENTVILMFHKLNQQQQYRPLLYQFSHDPLTRLANRNTLQQSINHLHDDYKKFGNTYSILLLDVDRFKLINDNYGHNIGDQLLQLVAERMQFFIRDKDNIGRWGGEEFLCILPDAGINTACKIAERLCQGIAEKNFFLQEHKIPVTVSIGIAKLDENDSTATLYKRADEALYLSKKQGRNMVTTVPDAANASTLARN